MRSSFILNGMTRFCVILRIKRNILIFWSSGWIYKCQEDIVDLHATIYYIYFANDKRCAPFQSMYATMRLYYAPGAPIKSNVLRRNTREINDSLESKRISASLRVAHIHTRADSRQAQRLESVRIQWLNLLLTKYIRRSFCDTQARAIIVHSDSADLINYRNIYNYYLTFLVVRRRRATDLCMRSYAELQSPMHVLRRERWRLISPSCGKEKSPNETEEKDKTFTIYWQRMKSSTRTEKSHANSYCICINETDKVWPLWLSVCYVCLWPAIDVHSLEFLRRPH